MPINELRSIATFIKAADLGSLRQAALAQGLSPQAASQALAQLEAHLGVRLFHRTTRQLSLTDEGRQFLETARPSLAGLQRALQMARRAKEGIDGPLRIVGPRSSFRPVLWPLVDAFCRLHPGVQPDLHLDDRLGNWVADRVDVGFRIGVSPDDGVIARRLFTLQLIVCASPDYLRLHGAPDHIDDLAAHRCCAFRHPMTGKVMPWSFKVDGALHDVDVVPALCTNEEGIEIDAALDGQAIGLLTSVTAAAPIRDGRLVPLLTAHLADQLALFVYYGSRAAQPARARAFIDLAIERLTDSREFMLSPKELSAAEAKGRKNHRRA